MVKIIKAAQISWLGHVFRYSDENPMPAYFHHKDRGIQDQVSKAVFPNVGGMLPPWVGNFALDNLSLISVNS
ncbi:hypothetical protein TNCV_2416901 [Trichonephila clavipes]|nr:hypothetical protein TNCV_2416901 [Trichonephila clavipes]